MPTISIVSKASTAFAPHLDPLTHSTRPLELVHSTYNRNSEGAAAVTAAPQRKRKPNAAAAAAAAPRESFRRYDGPSTLPGAQATPTATPLSR